MLKCPATAAFLPDKGMIEKITSEHNPGSVVLEKFDGAKENELLRLPPLWE
jgi:hypothetical protein